MEELRISVPNHLGQKFILPHVQKFMGQHTDVRLYVNINDGEVDVRDNAVDVRLSIGRCTSKVGIITRSLGCFDYCLVASPGYLVRRGKPKHPEQLVGHACLTEGADGHARWLLSNKSSVSVYGVFSSNDPEILREAAVSGVGVAFLPSWLVHEDLWARRLITILPSFTSRVQTGGSINLEYAIKHRHSRHIRDFIKLVQEALDLNCLCPRNRSC